MNYENAKLSGEDHFLHAVSQKFPRLSVFDVGANIGDYSNKVRALSPHAAIYAFEPHPKAFEKLQAQALRYSYEAVNSGLGEVPGQLKLYDYPGDGAGSQHASLYRGVIEQVHHAQPMSWDVDITTVDEFIRQSHIPSINLLKIDTEGNERNVLLGATHAIENDLIDLIQFEFNEMNVVSRVFMKDIYDLLPQYEFCRMLPDGLVPLGQYNAMFFEIFAFQNIVAIRRSRPDLLRYLAETTGAFVT